jgi:AraC-like DNA-binding protein
MISYNGIYLLKSFWLLKKFRREEKETFSFQQSPLTYLNFFLFSVSACLLAWGISFLNSTFFNGEIPYVNYESIWVAIPVFIYVIGYFSLKQPELFRIPFEEKAIEKKARLTEIEVGVLKKKLDSLMQNERVYLDSTLTLRDVAETLQTSTNNISWLLNNVYKTTFYDFINGFRVEEFIEKIKNKEHLTHTILALSMDVGFNSKSTFNKAFKFTMNDTPSNYIKKHRAA